MARVDGTVETPPCLKVTHKTFGSQNANTDLLFFRLSMPIEFHETFKVPAGTTLLTRALTIPEEEVVEVDPDSDFEILKKSATRKEQEEDKKEPSVPKEIPAIKNGENEKDASTEKSKKKGFVDIRKVHGLNIIYCTVIIIAFFHKFAAFGFSFLFKAKKAALINPPPVVPTMPRLVEDVVPDDRDDVDIILNTTTVRPK